MARAASVRFVPAAVVFLLICIAILFLAAASTFVPLGARRPGITRGTPLHFLALNPFVLIRRSFLLVDGYLLGRGLETNHELLFSAVHLNVIAVSLQSVGQHLRRSYRRGCRR